VAILAVAILACLPVLAPLRSTRGAPRGRPLLLPLLVSLAVNVVAVAAPALAPALTQGTANVPAACTRRVPLTSHSEMTLWRHNQWLETPPQFAEGGVLLRQFSPYAVVNARTEREYPWRVEEIDRTTETIRFSVLTRWSLLHPGWADDPWVLLYDCAPPGR